jgi:hypothetical protein
MEPMRRRFFSVTNPKSKGVVKQGYFFSVIGVSILFGKKAGREPPFSCLAAIFRVQSRRLTKYFEHYRQVRMDCHERLKIAETNFPPAVAQFGERPEKMVISTSQGTREDKNGG